MCVCDLKVKLLIFVTFMKLANSQQIPSMIRSRYSSCKKYKIERNATVGTIIVTNKEKKACAYNVRTLSSVSKQVLVFNANSMDCQGGGVSFPTVENSTIKMNFCPKDDCLAYTRRKLTLSNEAVQATIADAFDSCKIYQIIRKPNTMKIRADANTTSFRLMYKLYNITIPTTPKTVGTTTVPAMDESTTQQVGSETQESTKALEKEVTTKSPATTIYSTANDKSEVTTHSTVTDSDMMQTNGTDNPNKEQRRRKKINGAQSWHYALPITLGVIVIVGGIVTIFLYRRKKSKDKEMLQAHFSNDNTLGSKDNIAFSSQETGERNAAKSSNKLTNKGELEGTSQTQILVGNTFDSEDNIAISSQQTGERNTVENSRTL